MHWYLSFLRPPPVSAQVGGHVTITPQVANDLRTELRYETTHISYAWQRVFPGPAKVDTSLEYLTEFTPPASTYRPVNIPLPSNAKIGESWRLGLFAQDPDMPSGSTTPAASPLLNLIRDDPRPSVISVWSTPIEVCRPQGSSSSSSAPGGANKAVGGKSAKAARSSGAEDALSGKKGKGKGKESKEAEAPKQSRITREWAMGEDVSLKIIEQTSFDLDKKVWDSGLALSAWLQHRLEGEGRKDEDGLVSEIFSTLRRPDFRAIELGSGTGLVSLALALALNDLRSRQDSSPSSTPQIVTTDLESAIPLMEENLSLNGLTPSSSEPCESVEQRVLPAAKVLDWEQPLPDWVGESPDTQGEEGSSSWPDLIIAADVTYNTSSFPFLLSTLSALLFPAAHRGVRDLSPTLLLAYKQRDLAERELWEMLDKEDIEMRQVDVIQGSEDYGEVEIWVGRRRQL